MTMKERIQEILASIEKMRVDSGRNDEVALMAVSKTHPYEAIEEAFASGQFLFGENRVQEILDKFPEDRQGYELHLIGHLQSNKVKKAVKAIDAIDSVDSLRLARLINREAMKIGKVMPILLEWNTSGEDSKSGFIEEGEYFSLLDEASDLPGIRIGGLMTIGPLTDNEKMVRSAFAKLRMIADKSRESYPHISFDTLSMGMSQDYLWAIQEGSTVVRIGSAIFGQRDYT